MKKHITSEKRCIRIAEYMLENKSTVRTAAAFFGISKSTVHKDVSEKLKNCNCELYRKIRILLDTNKAERHIRGGEATKRKFNNCK